MRDELMKAQRDPENVVHPELLDLFDYIDFKQLVIAGHSMGAYTAYQVCQHLGKDKVKACLMMDPDWCAVEDDQLEGDTLKMEGTPVCVINSLSDLSDETYIDHKDRLKATWNKIDTEHKESYVIPGVGHVDFTDNAIIDPLWTMMLNGDQKLKTNGNDVCLVNTAIWLRYLTQLDEKLEPEIGAYCDEGGAADSFDAELIAKFDILDGHESHV